MFFSLSCFVVRSHFFDIRFLIFVGFLTLFFISTGAQFGFSISNLFNPLAFFSVFSGVCCIMLLGGFNLREALDIVADTRRICDISTRINELIYINEQIKRKGFTVCEQFQKKFNDQFIRKGLRIIADNPGPEFKLEEALKAEIQTLKNRNRRFLDLLNFGANVSPGVGLIGTLIGLSMNSHPTAISHAVLTTLYGAILANFFFIPLYQHFKQKLEHLELSYEVTFSGLIKLRDGLHSIYLEEHLSGYRNAVKHN